MQTAHPRSNVVLHRSPQEGRVYGSGDYIRASRSSYLLLSFATGLLLAASLFRHRGSLPKVFRPQQLFATLQATVCAQLLNIVVPGRSLWTATHAATPTPADTMWPRSSSELPLGQKSSATRPSLALKRLNTQEPYSFLVANRRRPRKHAKDV